MFYSPFARKLDMVLNADQNKRYGPGGGTRRLHHFYSGFMGAKQDRRA